MTMMIMMIIITFCALDILILEFLTCKWKLDWNMLIKIIIIDKNLKKLLLLLLLLLSLLLLLLLLFVFSSLRNFQMIYHSAHKMPTIFSQNTDGRLIPTAEVTSLI